MVRYGGNTSCVHVTLSDGTQLVLDAGTGIRNVPGEPEGAERHIHLLLTHLHLDHIQGLLFFSPLFRAESKITVWGPAAPGLSLRNRIGRYLSAPLTPIEVRELPCRIDFKNCPVSEWQMGSARIRAEAVTHRGPTLGFRIDDAGRSLCYLPDHEPAMIGPLQDLDPHWISGHALAHEVDLLFAEACGVKRTLLFHHDPYHTDDQLDAIAESAREQWQELGGAPGSIGMAMEGAELSVGAQFVALESSQGPT
jgi:phosphoribosyl 1,2-cyclic phosphodiesterase